MSEQYMYTAQLSADQSKTAGLKFVGTRAIASKIIKKIIIKGTEGIRVEPGRYWLIIGSSDSINPKSYYIKYAEADLNKFIGKTVDICSKRTGNIERNAKVFMFDYCETGKIKVYMKTIDK